MHKIPASLLLCNIACATAAEPCGVTYEILQSNDRHAAYEFAQSKMVGTISRPLRSSGLLGITAGGDLLWQTMQPLKSTIVADGGSIKIFNREDVLVNQLSSTAVQQLLDILLQIFSGDSEALNKSFVIASTCAADGSWQIQLEPRAGPMDELLLSVNIEGHDSIEVIGFREKRGDTTEIVLTPVPDARLEELERYLGD